MREGVDEFDAYLGHLGQALGHADRHAGLKGYCSGLVLPLSRKSVEPMAAHIDPLHASAKHQSLHHFVVRISSAVTKASPSPSSIAHGTHRSDSAGDIASWQHAART